jgi:hypothetical protein
MSSALRLPRERILALDPANVEAYLTTHGWEVDPDLSSSEAGVYHLPANPQAEVIVPRHKDFVDYALRVGETLQEAAVAERRTAWEVLEELTARQAESSRNGPAHGKRGRGTKDAS